ncbi:hypothetical protein [Nocardia sp. NPDC058633]|uniref:hypothetical protein n=1 Tax=Nocardia sp. NPDC058633 TaxID=3346568 RepID=UPI0036652B1C
MSGTSALSGTLPRNGHGDPSGALSDELAGHEARGTGATDFVERRGGWSSFVTVPSNSLGTSGVPR